MMEFLKGKYQESKRPLTFKAATREEAEAWQKKMYNKLVELLGGFPPSCGLNPEIVSSEPDEGYTRHKVVFDSEPGMSVIAWLLVPDNIKPGERRPAVIALHGHDEDVNAGKDNVIGRDYGEKPRREVIERYNYDYGKQFALRGCVVIAQDHRRWNERDCGYSSLRPDRDACDIIFNESLLFDLNPLMMNVWDTMRCVDYLKTRKDVDDNRIGTLGLSYGGTVSLFSAALDPRIKAAIVSCYLNTYEEYWLTLHNHCGLQTVPGLLKYAEMADVAGLIAPRPALYEMGVHDEGFPIEVARKAFAHVKQIYELMGAGDRIDADEFPGRHEFSGRKAFSFFDKWL
jgi:dienelactone hydrolase